MELKPVWTKRARQAELEHAERLGGAPAGSAEVDALDVLTLLIADYEAKHFPIPDPRPNRVCGIRHKATRSKPQGTKLVVRTWNGVNERRSRHTKVNG